MNFTCLEHRHLTHTPMALPSIDSVYKIQGKPHKNPKFGPNSRLCSFISNAPNPLLMIYNRQGIFSLQNYKTTGPYLENFFQEALLSDMGIQPVSTQKETLAHIQKSCILLTFRQILSSLFLDIPWIIHFWNPWIEHFLSDICIIQNIIA